MWESNAFLASVRWRDDSEGEPAFFSTFSPNHSILPFQSTFYPKLTHYLSSDVWHCMSPSSYLHQDRTWHLACGRCWMALGGADLVTGGRRALLWTLIPPSCLLYTSSWKKEVGSLDMGVWTHGNIVVFGKLLHSLVFQHSGLWERLLSLLLDTHSHILSQPPC